MTWSTTLTFLTWFIFSIISNIVFNHFILNSLNNGYFNRFNNIIIYVICRSIIGGRNTV